VNYEGKLIPVQKVRTKKKVIEAIEKKMEELAENGLAYDGKCYISHSACQADAEAVASLVESRFPNPNGRVTCSTPAREQWHCSSGERKENHKNRQSWM